MYASDLKLVPVKDMNAASKYRVAVQAFLDSGEPEIAVEGRQSLQTTYVGLRRAVSDMGLGGELTVHRRKGQAILERVG